MGESSTCLMQKQGRARPPLARERQANHIREEMRLKAETKNLMHTSQVYSSGILREIVK